MNVRDCLFGINDMIYWSFYLFVKFRQQSCESSDVNSRCEQVERLRKAEQSLRQRKLVQRQMRQLRQQQLSREMHATQFQGKGALKTS